MQKRKTKKKQGGNRMHELGYRPVQAWFEPAEMEMLQHACKLNKDVLTKFVVRATIAAASRIVREHESERS